MDTFDTALEFTLSKEGGLAFLKGDPGGLTNCGVTQASYDAYRDELQLPRQSVESMTPAEMRDTYFRWYWVPSGCPSVPVALALCLFDTAVHSGVRAAVKMLQEACGATPDGVIGDETRAAIEAVDLATVIDAFLQLRCQLLQRLSAPDKPGARFRKGWLQRVRDLKERAHQLLEGTHGG